MVRKLKHHEQKLLKKTDFITYKQVSSRRLTLLTLIVTVLTLNSGQ